MTVKLAVGGGRSLIVASGRALVALAQPVASAIGTASAASVVASRRDAVMTMRRVQAGRGSGRRLPACSPQDVILPGISINTAPNDYETFDQLHLATFNGETWTTDKVD